MKSPPIIINTANAPILLSLALHKLYITHELTSSNMNCPIEVTLQLIGKKWSINILRDLFMDHHRFKDFLKRNPELSTKMLSARLKELEQVQLIEKRIISTSPVIIEYHLTKKGKGLNRLLYEICAFSICNCTKELKTSNHKAREKHLKEAQEVFINV